MLTKPAVSPLQQCKIYCPRRDIAQKAKSRGGTLEARAYIISSTYSLNIQSVCQKKPRFA